MAALVYLRRLYAAVGDHPRDYTCTSGLLFIALSVAHSYFDLYATARLPNRPSDSHHDQWAALLNDSYTGEALISMECDLVGILGYDVNVSMQDIEEFDLMAAECEAVVPGCCMTLKEIVYGYGVPQACEYDYDDHF